MLITNGKTLGMGRPPAPQSHEATKVGKKSSFATLFLTLNLYPRHLSGFLTISTSALSQIFNVKQITCNFLKCGKKRDAPGIPLKNLRFTRLSYTKNLAKNKTARMYMTTDTSLVRPVRSLSTT